jgi:hypothetical protein
MKVAIMQPYIFPYLGYFQLINAVDNFVLYDDVNFIKGGWIHRNRILVNNTDSLFTVPLSKLSSFSPINETKINEKSFEDWKKKFLRSIELAYKKAPNFLEINSLIRKVLDNETLLISDLAINSIKQVLAYLDISVNVYVSSEHFSVSKSMNRVERIVSICNDLNSKVYINAIGGTDLYHKEEFKEKGLQLSFIKSQLEPYKQFNNTFISGLSIIDVLMFNSIDEVRQQLNNYTLI